MTTSPEEKRRYWRDYHIAHRAKRLKQMATRDQLRRGPLRRSKENAPIGAFSARPPMARLIENLLDAPAFDAAAVAHCGHRNRYADAALLLLREMQSRQVGQHAFNPIMSLCDPHATQLRPFRLAVECGAITEKEISARHDFFGIADLRALAVRVPRAKLALAALGELDGWSAAPRELRAAYALGALVAARRAS